jgi:hypothetical protein
MLKRIKHNKHGKRGKVIKEALDMDMLAEYRTGLDMLMCESPARLCPLAFYELTPTLNRK